MYANAVHLFHRGGHHFLVDGNSGAIHVVDSLAALVAAAWLNDSSADQTALRHAVGEQCSDVEFEEAWQELRQLQDHGLLFSPDLQSAPPRPDHVVKALCLNVAHDCNLRCRYCFAGTGDFGGTRQMMPLSVAKQAIDFLITNSGSRRQIEVDFFGGEPLMNWEVVKAAVAYGREQAKKYDKDLRFTLTTNGVLLTSEVIDFLNDTMYNVVLSLDGRPAINDAARTTISGEGSVHDIIVPKYRELVEKRAGKSYYLRGTFTRNNLDFAADVLHMADLGFEQLSMEPVVGAAEADYSILEEHLPVILDQYEKLADIMLERRAQGRPFSFFHFQLELKKGPCLYKRISGCGAGSEYLAVDPDGFLFPCHQFVGQEQFRLGHVSEGVGELELVQKFQDSHVLNKPTCGSCWAKYYCSGGCHANNLAFNQDFSIPYAVSCTMEKSRLENAIYLHFTAQNR